MHSLQVFKTDLVCSFFLCTGERVITSMQTAFVARVCDHIGIYDMLDLIVLWIVQSFVKEISV